MFPFDGIRRKTLWKIPEMWLLFCEIYFMIYVIMIIKEAMELAQPKNITPLLGNHIIGDAISSRNGIRCCPVMEQDTENKYILKILSLPPSQTQVDALLLTGICQDKESARDYYEQAAQEIIQEAELLQKLSKSHGFVGFAGWQTEPMEEDNIGCEVYLLADYRSTLARYMARNPMTHLGAVNLGLDLCAALALSRENGYLYVALKPENVYITPSGEYRIGDLGFIAMDSLNFASLPDKYRSEYTPPEIQDALSTLNSTLDIYALGLILYQAYNNGQLPQSGENGEILPPAYADYEISEIILKACAANPEERWQSPLELGQALVSYLQRNSINDTLIVPTPIVTEDAPAQEEEPQDAFDEDDETQKKPKDEADELEQLAFSLTDETAPSEEILKSLQKTKVTSEVSEILSQAEDLMDLQPPAPVVAPDPVFVPIPEPIVLQEEENETPAEDEDAKAAEEAENTQQTQEAPSDEPEAAQEDAPVEEAEAAETEEELIPEEPTKKPRKFNGIIVALSVILAVLLFAAGGFYFYESYVVKTVDNLTLSGAQDYLNVTLDTDVDSSLLTVVCTDTYGNTKQQSVVNHQAYFTGLTPDTQYRITVKISGFHRLIGATTDSYTTASRTEILNFTAVTGSEDGSVILNFAVQGDEETHWKISYSAPGEEEKSQEFTGHILTLNGLTLGKTYTFRLKPVSDIYVVGNSQLEHTASALVYPQNLTVLGFQNNMLHATWQAPEGTEVSSWNVRCYNNAGYDKTFTVSEPKIAIEGLDPAQGYTISVNAQGMSQGKTTHVSENSVTVNNLKLDDSVDGALTLTWEYEGVDTDEGWLVLYTVNGSKQQVIRCEGAKATISPLIPGGEYSITIQPPSGTTVFGGVTAYTASGGDTFNSYGITADEIRFRMCWTPRQAGWHWYSLYERDFSTTYKVGERASYVLIFDRNVTAEGNVSVLFVVKDAENNPVSIESISQTWQKTCYDRHGELDIPIMPTTPGSYTMDIYFDGALANTQAFTVTE